MRLAEVRHGSRVVAVPVELEHTLLVDSLGDAPVEPGQPTVDLRQVVRVDAAREHVACELLVGDRPVITRAVEEEPDGQCHRVEFGGARVVETGERPRVRGEICLPQRHPLATHRQRQVPERGELGDDPEVPAVAHGPYTVPDLDLDPVVATFVWPHCDRMAGGKKRRRFAVRRVVERFDSHVVHVRTGLTVPWDWIRGAEVTVGRHSGDRRLS